MFPNKMFAASQPAVTAATHFNSAQFNEKKCCSIQGEQKLEIIFWYDHFLRGKALNRLTELECKRQKSLPGTWQTFGLEKWEESGKTLM